MGWRNFNLTLKNLFEYKYTGRIIILFCLLFAVGIYYWATHYFTYSRDAYVYANVVGVSSQVSGQVSKVYVKNHQAVKKGQILVEIDPTPFQYRVDHHQARLSYSELNFKIKKYELLAAEAVLKQHQDALAKAVDKLRRYEVLQKSGSIAEIILVDIQFKVSVLEDKVLQAQRKLAIAEKKITNAQIKEAEAELNTAKYHLQQTKIRAATDGYITNFLMKPGDYIEDGDKLFALVDTSQWWVIARYRETVLRRIRIGDKADIDIDMYPHKTFHGTVTSIGWGINRRQASNTAASSSLTYVEPTEYWIRIAQRFPVWIKISEKDLGPETPLRVGANARTYIKH